MRQWRSLVPSLHLHAAAPPCFPHPPCRHEDDDEEEEAAAPQQPPPPAVVRLVGCDGRVRSYPPPVTARELMQQHPRHLVCRADALLIGERIPAVAAGEELQPGQAYFLLPAHLFRSVLSFVSLASSLLLLLSTAAASAGGGGKGGAKAAQGRPFELHRTAAGALQIKFSDDFLLLGGQDGQEKEKQQAARPAVLRGDERLAKEYEELVGYAKSRRWAPKLDTIQEVVAAASPNACPDNSGSASGPDSSKPGRKSRALPFLGRPRQPPPPGRLQRRGLLRLGPIRSDQ